MSSQRLCEKGSKRVRVRKRDMIMEGKVKREIVSRGERQEAI